MKYFITLVCFLSVFLTCVLLSNTKDHFPSKEDESNMKEEEKGLVVLLLLAGLLQSNSLKCPRYCSCTISYESHLKTVECVAKQLINIDLGIPFEVQSLDLSNNTISILDDRGFQDLGLLDIIEIYLRFNSIRSIGLHAFAGLIHLRHLDLTGNHLYHILPWTFHDNPSIRQLILTNNPIGHTDNDNGILLDVPTLEVLDVANCHFAHLSQDIFIHMQDLQVINMSGNQLIGLDTLVLAPLPMLRIIDISRNQWPCNTNMKQIEDWLSSQSVQLIGSSCDIDNHGGGTQKPKLERMISLVEDDNSLSDEEELDKYWTENKRHNSSSCNCQTYNTTLFPSDLSDKIKINIPSPWIFVIGFQFGILFALFSAFIWVSWNHPKKTVERPCPSEETQPIIVMEPVCPETPPPTYRDLFYV